MKAKVPYKKKKKRRGLGNGSGHGKTSCRGQKGQLSRSGVALTPIFEGGQNPLYRRLPKRGFNQERFRMEKDGINLDRLNKIEETEITPQLLVQKGIIHKRVAFVKILGIGEASKGITVKAHGFSESAKKKIEDAGGKAVVLAVEPKYKARQQVPDKK